MRYERGYGARLARARRRVRMDSSVTAALFSLDVRDLLPAARHVSAGSVTGRTSVRVPLHPPTWPANRDRDGGGGEVDEAVTRLSL